MTVLFGTTSYSERVGAAYGLAAVLKGSMSLIADTDIVAVLQDNLNSTEASKREASLLLVQKMSRYMGVLFEGHLVTLMPQLLIAVGDNDVMVRPVAEKCVRDCMSMLSQHGIRMVLPVLISVRWTDCDAIRYEIISRRSKLRRIGARSRVA